MIDALRRIVISVGNPQRGDDAAGCEVVVRLRNRLPPGVELIEEFGEGAAILAHMEGARAAYLVDACASGVPPGTVHRFDVAASCLPRSLRACSTHGLGIAEAIELARALGTLPEHCILYAVEGESYGLGAPLSSPVRAAVSSLAEHLATELMQSRPG